MKNLKCGNCRVEIHTLQSNSQGNCIILNFNHKFKIALDLGIERGKIMRYMKMHHLDALDYTFLSHEHIDHMRGVGMPGQGTLLASQGTLSKINLKNSKTQTLPLEKWVKLNKEHKVKVYSFSTVHPEALAPRALVLKVDKCKIVYLTDTGNLWHPQLKRAQMYFIEANYGTELLPKSKHYKYRRQSVNSDEHLTLTETEALLVRAKAWKANYIQLTHMETPKDETLLRLLSKRMKPAIVVWPKFKK